MKNLIICLSILALTASCKKYKGPYQQVPDPIDTTSWQDSYINGGVLPGGGTQTQNTLVDTKWVIFKIVSAFSTNYPNDTINFVTSNRYILNQNAERPYTYGQITGSSNKSLTLYYFYPFGGSHYSGQISPYAVEDGQMDNIEFTDLQNNTSTIRVWLKKI